MLVKQLTAIAFALSTTTIFAAQPSNLQSVLNQLDAAAAHFKSAQANVRLDNYTRAARASNIETGKMYVEKAGSTNRMGAIDYMEGGSSPAKILDYDNGILQMYEPGTNQDTIFKAGANQAKYESFLTLGFGGSGKALQQDWNIVDQGSEMLNDGGLQVSTEKLDLTSKDPAVQNMFKHVTVWIDPVRGVSLKQKFYTPEGDTRTAEYSNIKVNAKIEKKPYAISKDAVRIQHQ